MGRTGAVFDWAFAGAWTLPSPVHAHRRPVGKSVGDWNHRLTLPTLAERFAIGDTSPPDSSNATQHRPGLRVSVTTRLRRTASWSEFVVYRPRLCPFQGRDRQRNGEGLLNRICHRSRHRLSDRGCSHDAFSPGMRRIEPAPPSELL
jgi:hypothetical protein